MEQETRDCLSYLSKLEEVAQDILIDREHIVDYSKRSNVLREAKRALESELRKDQNGKTWLCMGNIFIKCPKAKALAIVDKDKILMDEEINKLRDNLKPKVANMRNLEGLPEPKFNLKPLDKDELKAMKGILPTVI